MTHYEQYEAIATYVLAEWRANHPEAAYVLGEAIKTKPPYITVDIYGIGTDSGFTCSSNVQVCNIKCYGQNRGITHKLVSDVQEQFQNKSIGSLQIEDVRIEDQILRLDEGLFEGVVKFTTRG